MAETPFNPEAAGAESPADDQTTAPGMESSASQPLASEHATASEPGTASELSVPPETSTPEPAAAPDPPAAPESFSSAGAPAAPEPPAAEAPPASEPPSAGEQPPAAVVETVVTELREEVRETLVVETSPPEPPAPAEPGVAASYEVPALEAAAGAEGGEWDLLRAKLSDWFQGGELQQQWNRLQGPLRGLALLIGLVLVLRLYSGVIGTLDSLPLVPGLLELVGVIAFARFCLTRLVRTSERERLLSDWSRRWQEFRGRG